MVGSSGRSLQLANPSLTWRVAPRHNGVRRGSHAEKDGRVQCTRIPRSVRRAASCACGTHPWARVAVVHRVDGRSRSRALDEAATAVLATAARPSHTSTTTNQGSRITLKIS